MGLVPLLIDHQMELVYEPFGLDSEEDGLFDDE